MSMTPDEKILSILEVLDLVDTRMARSRVSIANVVTNLREVFKEMNPDVEEETNPTAGTQETEKGSEKEEAGTLIVDLPEYTKTRASVSDSESKGYSCPICTHALMPDPTKGNNAYNCSTCNQIFHIHAASF